MLVVDDEEIVRSSITGMLHELGYEPIAASSGERALEIFKSSESPFALAILDIVMPRMNGPQLLKQLRQSDGNLPVILSSGYWTEDQIAPLESMKISGFTCCWWVMKQK